MRAPPAVPGQSVQTPLCRTDRRARPLIPAFSGTRSQPARGVTLHGLFSVGRGSDAQPCVFTRGGVPGRPGQRRTAVRLYVWGRSRSARGKETHSRASLRVGAFFNVKISRCEGRTAQGPGGTPGRRATWNLSPDRKGGRFHRISIRYDGRWRTQDALEPPQSTDPPIVARHLRRDAAAGP